MFSETRFDLYTSASRLFCKGMRVFDFVCPPDVVNVGDVVCVLDCAACSLGVVLRLYFAFSFV